ncbi:MAG TPA: nitrite reductase large subunit [Deltaproteobacteria bacterium]|nr:nitrite reductase large subunit [Deltaproteobacteria bacterium]
MSERRLVMIGNGMAGLACLDAALQRDSTWRTTVLGEEPHPGYNRILLSTLLAGECDRGEAITHDADWYEKRGVELRAGVRAVAIDRARRVVHDEAGGETPYDRLILATGSEAFVPPMEGTRRRGVHVFRTLDDVEAILAQCRRARRAVVIGGGLLGLEAARGIAKRKVDTTVVHLMPWLMEQQLDAAGGALLRDAIQRLGIRVLLERKTVRLDGPTAGSPDACVERVILEGGESIDADLVVIAVGIRPRVELAKQAGLEVRRGVIVDDYMRTSDPAIFAVGECTEHRGRTYGLVAPLYEQGTTLAHALHEDFSKPYEGSTVYAKLKVAGVNLLSIGRFAAEREPQSAAQALRVEDPGTGLYRKVVLDQGRVVGAILFGAVEDGPRLVNLVMQQVKVGDEAERRALLLGSLAAGTATASAEADEMARVAAIDTSESICGCMGVSKGALVAAIERGATTLSELKKATRASSSCGSCAGTCQMLIRLVTGEAAGARGPKLLCDCVPHPKEQLRVAIRNQKLRKVSEVLQIYGNGVGCERCHPALAFLVEEVWQGAHEEQRNSRFINDRVHANIQKDGTFSVVPRMRGGVTSPQELRRIADVAEKYAVPMVKITGGQRVDLLGVRKEELPAIWRDLGMPSGHAYSKAVRTVKTCVGSDFCRFGVGDSTSLGVKLEETTERLHTPHKVKMGVTGCPRNCAEVTIKDIGILAIQGGWEVYVGGAAGMRVRKADLLARVEAPEEALRVSHLFLQYYRENAEYMERSYDFVERLGITRVKAETVDALPETQAALLERFQRSRELAAEPWSTESEKPATANQFSPLPPVQVVPELAGTFVRVARLDDVPVGEGRAVTVGSTAVALFRIDEKTVRATQARCPHAGGPLADGIVSGGRVTCPLHAWRVDLSTGEASSPAGNCIGVATYEVEVRGAEIFLRAP